MREGVMGGAGSNWVKSEGKERLPNERAVSCSCSIASNFDIRTERLGKHEVYAEREVDEAGCEGVGQAVVLHLTCG